jgi:hypothetical protein
VPVVKPGKVENLVLTDNSIEAITLSWTAPSKLGTEPITDYNVKYKFDDFGGWLTWKHDASPIPGMVIGDLPLGRGITFAVRPVTATTAGLPVKLHVVTAAPADQAPLAGAAQQEYNFVSASWNSHSSKFGYYPGHDCANWASQALLQRGFTQNAKWHARQSRLHGATTAWISSASLHNYLLATGKATLLTDSQRALVAVGDIVQFDWWNTGAQEHTGIVTHIEQTPAGPKIYYASHTAHGMWWSVDRSVHIAYPGATATYLHLN